ncbi:MAG: diaminopimelate decarboxylase [Phycisphaerales bacterium]
MDHFAYHAGRLHCERLSVTDLAERFGTPSYIYSRATLLDHYDRLAAAFAELDPLICYSIKSCANLHICRVLAERSAGMDVVSGGELERAFLAGVPMEKVVYAGVGKTDAEIMAALDGRHSLLRDAVGPPNPPPPPRAAPPQVPDPSTRGPIGYFNIESEPEFETIAAIARRLGIRSRGALRVNPDVDPRTHAYTSTGKKETKFGVDIERAVRFFERYGNDEFLRLDAIHLHIGSPVYETAPYIAAIGKTLALIDDLERRGHRINALDLGGGFGADYETDKSPPAADYAAAIVPLLRARCGRDVPADRRIRLILEPGRTISANAGILLTRVLYVKEGGAGKRFIICDAGMHTLIRPALYSAFHFIWPAEVSPQHIPARRAADMDLPGLIPADIVGPICESGDFLAKDRKLPPVKRGDIIAVFTAGAYGMAMASNYNTQPMPAEVLVDGAEARVIRRRQTTADLVAPELP